MFHGLTDLLPSPFQIGGRINKFVTPWVQTTTIGLILMVQTQFFYNLYLGGFDICSTLLFYKFIVMIFFSIF
jgi:hypothetical protein